MDPETGLPTTQKMTEGELLQIEKLVADAIGIDEERGDSLTVSSAPFMSEALFQMLLKSSDGLKSHT